MIVSLEVCDVKYVYGVKVLTAPNETYCRAVEQLVIDAINENMESWGLTRPITFEDLKGKSHRRVFVNARHMIVLFWRDWAKLSFPIIGEKLNRDHTTAMASYKRGHDLARYPSPFKGVYNSVYSALANMVAP